MEARGWERGEGTGGSEGRPVGEYDKAVWKRGEKGWREKLRKRKGPQKMRELNGEYSGMETLNMEKKVARREQRL